MLLDETKTRVIKESYIAKAVHYTLNQWEKLTRYINDGELGIDNNITERDISPLRPVEKTGCSVNQWQKLARQSIQCRLTYRADLSGE